MSASTQRLVGYALLALLVAAGAVAGIVYTMGSPHATNGYTAFYVQLTDPPELPRGTTSLVVEYSGTGIHTEGGWVTSSTSGTIDLLNLTNISETIASSSVPVGSVVNAVRFDIASAVITVKNTVYNVTVPSNHLQVTVNGATKLGGTSATLVSFNAKVFEITLGGNSKPFFILVPSATAIFVPPSQVNSKAEKVGAKVSLAEQMEQEIDNIRASISVQAGLGVSHGQTELTVSVTNNGNSSVMLLGLSLRSVFNYSGSFTAACTSTGSSSGQGNISMYGGSASVIPCVDDNIDLNYTLIHEGELAFLVNSSSCATSVANPTTGSTSTTSSVTYECALITPLQLIRQYDGYQPQGTQSNDNAQGDEYTPVTGLTPIIIQPGQTYILTYGPATIGYTPFMQGSTTVSGSSETSGVSPAVISAVHESVAPIAGDNYTLHMFASNNAEMRCIVQAQSTIPPALQACTPARENLEEGGNSFGYRYRGIGQGDSIVAVGLVSPAERLA